MSMTRREAAAITRLWRGWIQDRKTNNRAYRECVLDVIRAEPGLQHLDLFDILDAIVNGGADIDAVIAGLLARPLRAET